MHMIYNYRSSRAFNALRGRPMSSVFGLGFARQDEVVDPTIQRSNDQLIQKFPRNFTCFLNKTIIFSRDSIRKDIITS